MIPRRIHYCWLSDEPMPKKMLGCMASWKRMLPGCEVVLWDKARVEHAMSENADFNSAWVRYWLAKRNYAFATDYIRLWALWREGGLYLDTDVEIVKPIDGLLDRKILLGEEGGTGDVEAALIGAREGDDEIKSVLDSFSAITDETLPKRMKRLLPNVELLPSVYFSPKNLWTGKVAATADTYAIHHFAGSWLSRRERMALWCGRRMGRWSIPVVRWIGCRIGL